MDPIRKGARVGALIGLTLLVLLAVGVGGKLLTGASWEVLEWAGVMAIVLGFPTSMATEALTGVGGLVALLVAVVVNWALAGSLIGAAVSLVMRRQERRA